MAINPHDKWPTQTVAGDANQQYGYAKDVIVPGDGTGTPFDEYLINDDWGFKQALLTEAGIAPSGLPDTAANSQYLTASNKLFLGNKTLAQAVAAKNVVEGARVIISDRGDGLFEYKTGQTPNTFNIIACTGVPTLSLVLVINNKTILLDTLGAGKNLVTKAAEILTNLYGGGVIELVGRYEENETNYNVNYFNYDNITLRGIGGDVEPNDDCSALRGGAIIEGRFNAWCHNFKIEGTIGFDCGKAWVDANYPGADVTTSSLRGGTWDAFAFAQPNIPSPEPQRNNFNIAGKVVGLCYDHTALGHAVLCEGMINSQINHTVGIYGIHGVVFKAQNTTVGIAEGYGNLTDSVICKSDSYANCADLQGDTAIASRYYPNRTMHTTPSSAEYGLYYQAATANMESVRWKSLNAKGVRNQHVYACNPGSQMSDCYLGDLYSNGFGNDGQPVIAYKGFSGTYNRCGVGEIDAVNTTVTVQIENLSNSMIQIDRVRSKNNSLWCIEAVEVTTFIRVGIVDIEDCVGAAYSSFNGGRIAVGDYNFNNVGGVFNGYIPTLANGWTETGGVEESFGVYLKDFEVKFYGHLTPALSQVIFSDLPVWLRPVKNIKRPILAKDSGVAEQYSTGVTVTTTGTLAVNDAAGAPPSEFVSLGGVGYKQ